MKTRFFALLSLSLLSSTEVSALSLNGFDPSLYGFIRVSSTYSTDAVGSFNNINASAPTHLPAQTRPQDETSRLSFQTQQSRIGTVLKKDNIQGRLEFDFVDFNKSSPTTQMNPRVRIANITYVSGEYTFMAGQDWDLFSPVNAYTFNFVGNYFLGGNTGFMRQQFQVLKKTGSWEIGGAVGMAGNNPGTTDNDLEVGKAPTYSGRISYELEKGRAGFSAIYSNLKYSTNFTRHESYGLNLFFEKTFGNTNIKSEVYYAQNLANIGSLSIGKGTDETDVKEFGGMLTFQQKITDSDFIFGGLGLAKIDNRKELSPFALNAQNVITSPGIDRNFVSRIGWEKKITEDLSWITEATRFETNSKLPNKYQLNTGYDIETGFNLKF